jgi:hypothetical protein
MYYYYLMKIKLGDVFLEIEEDSEDLSKKERKKMST